jgi:hypothetical protein
MMMDPGLFPTKVQVQAHLLLRCAFAALFWYHFIMGVYWLLFFKMQRTPWLLLPGVLDGNEYLPHDVMAVILLSVSILCVLGALLLQNNTFVFLVDREKRDQAGGSEGRSQSPSKSNLGASAYGGSAMGGLGGSNRAIGAGGYGGGAAMGGSQMGGGMGGSHGSSSAHPDSPDKGISVWRSLFVGNELNERINQTRTSGYVTWLLMVALVDRVAHQAVPGCPFSRILGVCPLEK